MKTITITVPEDIPMMAVAKFAAEVGCDTAVDADRGDWTFTKAEKAKVATIESARIRQIKRTKDVVRSCDIPDGAA